MTTNYTPREGSVPARIIEHLQRHGGALTTHEAAMALGIEAKNIGPSIAAALHHGVLLKHRPSYGGAMLLCLPGADLDQIDASSSGTAAEPDAKAQKRGTAGRAAAAAKQAKKKATARAVRVKEPEALPPPTPICALWDDGDYVLCNVEISDDGQVILPEPRARQLYLFLHRQFATEARTE